MSHQHAFKHNLSRALPVFLAFIIPIAALSLIFYLHDIYPFGDEMYLRSDMYHQYAAFLKEFQNILKGDKSLLYSWNIGLGSGLVSTYAYYLATPLYWLIVFIPSSQLTTFMDALVVLKAGLMSATLVYYLNSKFKRHGITAVPFGVFYALSAYMAAYSWNLMWLDCLVLLPLVMLGIERLISEKKVILYTVTLFLCIFSNYYIAIMICIFLALYFIYLVICENKFEGVAEYFSAAGRFALYSFLAGMMAAVLIVPTIFAMGYTGSMNNTFPSSLYAYHNVLEMMSKALMCSETTMISGHLPNIFCTMALFLLFPLYWLNGKIKLSARIGKTLLLAVFLFSFTFNIPAYIWHGFHYPNSLPARHSFIYIALLLVIAYEALIRIRQNSLPEIIIVWVLASFAAAGIYYLYREDYSGYSTLICSLCMLFVYAVLIVFIKKMRLHVIIMVILLVCAAVTESVINTASTGYGTTSRSSYYDDNESISDVLAEINDEDGFYRVEKDDHRTKNDGAWSDYMSASIFSSATNDGVKDFYQSFGMQASLNSISYYGHTPIVTAILGVEYEMFTNETDDPLLSLYTSDGDILLYETDYALSAGYLVNADANEAFNAESDNPFEVQNSYVTATGGAQDVFIIQDSSFGFSPQITLNASGRTYIYLSDDVDSANVRVIRDGKQIFDEKYSLSHRYILDLGELNADDIINVTAADDDEAVEIDVYAGVFNYDAFCEWYNILADEQLNILEFDDGYVKGTVNAADDSLLLTSIPYDLGWSIYVDGEKVQYQAFAGAFISAELTAGEHTIEFKYFPEGLPIGAVISALALLIFILLCVIKHLKRSAAPAVLEDAKDVPESEIALNVMNSIRMRQKNSEMS